MTRIKGTFPYSANLEPKKKAPLDARAIVQTLADLTDPLNWVTDDMFEYTYPGMIVSVTFDLTEENNGLYRLKYADYSIIDNWEKIGEVVNNFTINGINPRGYFVFTDFYDTGDLVRVENGEMYYCLSHISELTPGVDNNWQDYWVLFSLSGSAGKNGDTPYIGPNRNWWIAGIDKGIKAEGKNGKPGKTPYIGINGNWWIENTETDIPEDTGYKAVGVNGKEYLPSINPTTKTWWLPNSEGVYTDTGYKAIAEDGAAAIANINLRGTWTSSATYNNNINNRTDVVYGSDGNMYYCKVNGTTGASKNPVNDTSHTYWYLYSQQGKKGENAPQVLAQYSETGEPGSWHTLYNSEADAYIHFSFNNGSVWGDAIYIRGTKGDKGEGDYSDVSLFLGSIIMWAGSTLDIPQGFALCNGNGGTPINGITIPDLRQRFIVGYDPDSPDYNAVGNKDGKEKVRLTSKQSALVDHDHLESISSSSGSGKTAIHNSNLIGTSDQYRSGKKTSKASQSLAEESHENRPPYYVLAYLIKVSYTADMNGKTAYDVYLQTTEDNPVLTKQQWLDSLKGEKGESGTYNAELISKSTTVTLKLSTETVMSDTLTNADTLTVALPTPVAGKVNESVLIFKIGASVPTINHPSGTVWRGVEPYIDINQTWTFVYEQVRTGTLTYETMAVAVKNI